MRMERSRWMVKYKNNLWHLRKVTFSFKVSSLWLDLTQIGPNSCFFSTSILSSVTGNGQVKYVASPFFVPITRSCGRGILGYPSPVFLSVSPFALNTIVNIHVRAFHLEMGFCLVWHAENEIFVRMSLGYKVIELPEPITFLESWDIVFVKQ